MKFFTALIAFGLAAPSHALNAKLFTDDGISVPIDTAEEEPPVILEETLRYTSSYMVDEHVGTVDGNGKVAFQILEGNDGRKAEFSYDVVLPAKIQTKPTSAPAFFCSQDFAGLSTQFQNASLDELSIYARNMLDSLNADKDVGRLVLIWTSNFGGKSLKLLFDEIQGRLDKMN